MSKRRMVGWQPLSVENTDAPAQSPADIQTRTPVESTAPEQVSAEPTPAPSAPVAEPQVEQPAEPAVSAHAPVSSGSIKDPSAPRRLIEVCQPLSVANTAAPDTAAAVATKPVAELPQSTASKSVAQQPVATADTEQTVASAQSAQSSGPIQDPEVPR